MNRNRKHTNAGAEIVFLPALTPLEAAMLPARERPARGALAHAVRDIRRSFSLCAERGAGQRTKIWVR